jgi:hypothetical protein
MALCRLGCINVTTMDVPVRKLLILNILAIMFVLTDI